MTSYDLMIRGGLVVDGSGGEPFEADVAITGDRVAPIGKNLNSGREEIDARGKIVTAGSRLLKAGYKADVNVIDLDRLHLHAPHATYDLPAGGRRLMQRARGYEASIVSSQVIYREGKATGAMPGRLVRSGRAAH